MKNIILLIFIFFLYPSLADAQMKFNPITGKFDRVGVSSAGDVSADLCSASQILQKKADNTGWECVANTASAGATSLTGLSDVNSATQGSGRILVSDGANFNSALAGGECTIAPNGTVDCDIDGDTCWELDAENNLVPSTSCTAGSFGTLTATSGNILVANGSLFNSVAMSGSCTLASNGAITCPSASGATNLTGLSDVNSATQGAGRILISNGFDFHSVVVGGDATLSAGGDVQLGSGVVGATELASSGVSANTYTNTTLTVDEDGRITSASSGSGGGASSLTGLTDVNSATQGAGRILVSDGFDFQSTTVSGDIAITSGGVVSVNADSVTLTTDTVGSYAAGDAEAGNATGVACTDCVALGTETSGNYAAGDAEAGAATSVAAGTVGASQITSSGVTAGEYRAATLTVDADGRVTAAASSSLTGLSDVNTATAGSGRILINNGTKFNSVALGGDITVDSFGTSAIGSSKVTSAMIVDDTITASDIAGVNSLTATSGRLLVADGNGFNSVSVYRVVGASIKSPSASTNYAGPKAATGKNKTLQNCECLQVGGTNAKFTLAQCDGSQASCSAITQQATCTTSSTSMTFTGAGTWTGGNDLQYQVGTFSGTPTDFRWSCELEL